MKISIIRRDYTISPITSVIALLYRCTTSRPCVGHWRPFCVQCFEKQSMYHARMMQAITDKHESLSWSSFYRATLRYCSICCFCPPVCRKSEYYSNTAKHRITQTALHDMHKNSSFLLPRVFILCVTPNGGANTGGVGYKRAIFLLSFATAS